ncbi:hypothetical protein [Rhodococcus pyridinivorans]|uniref:Uncharacterized protein n=1 Tax=Rhodococcus pyridinivorans AK37 TaxID=1114960 RepID=H0JXH2_9NOCA|nr:hypothetical protein [Rhodococcus pyridinivorans]EHK80867.1 hypothetical protein AK37_22246 [Rhodococcus pyridinivorans AK37]MCD2142335.1 hypothetical protein [Rhodococcus pyridinivorans]
MQQEITLYSGNTRTIRMITRHFADTSFTVTTRNGTPDHADFVVTTGGLQRPVEVFAAQLGATTAVIPEALLYLTGQAHNRGGLVLVGSDRKAQTNE